jgi:predicted nucleic acid-binding protein
VPRVWVVNASPLILLARIQRLDLQTSQAETVRVPQSVIRELDAGNSRDGAADAVRAAQRISIVPDRLVSARVQLWDLGAGEAHVIADALEASGAEAVLDDLAARRCARSLGLSVLGTLAVVVTARRRGVIVAARPLINQLYAQGMRITPELARKALAEVGEE